MAHSNGKPERIHYVGDSRIPAKEDRMYPKDYTDYPGKTEAFFPDFLLREWMVGVVFLVGFMALVLTEPAPLGNIADPTNTGFIPMPDWYFMFLYQLLKYEWSSGVLTPIGTLVIPGVAFTAMILAPWLDRGKERRPSKRPVAVGSMLIALVAVFYLTWAAVDQHAKNELAQNGAGAGGGGGGGDVAIVNEDSEGYEIYKGQSCVGCHATDLSGGNAPALLGVGDRRTKDEIIDIIDNGVGTMPAQPMENDKEKEKLAAWLAEQKADGGEEGDKKGEEDKEEGGK
ncbi:menaquinol-cytochrome c reductase cytochrome b/c subunit [Numidum massiliense]|uniref:menaquinol-cytochrome c reductase cytochrome b/c subunit n=1 Tax=Numidum massiliense TaxID=1522315 RepID=UPI0006D5963A|nr:menaquinol-cytochrome c reductase cytochrome b/c subunit [Numidum massiliense]